MPRRILVPLDGSDLANDVLPWVDALAPALEADVELVHVLDRDLASESAVGEVAFNEHLATGAASSSGPIAAEALGADPREDDARQDLARARERLARVQTVELRVVEGSPVETIVARAATGGATLVAMASHGRTGFDRTMMGSVAGDVVRQSPVPVVVIRRGLPPRAWSPHSVLVPLDLSEVAEAALWAIEPLVRELRWEIILFHAVEMPQTVSVQGAAISLGRSSSHRPDEVVSYLEAVAAKLQSKGVGVSTLLGSGNAADALALGAEESGADLIAMGTHGRSGLGRWVLGSVTEATIGRAQVPLVVVGPHLLQTGP